MKKPNLLTALLLFLLLIAGFIVGGFFIVNLIILPKVAVPRIQEQVKTALGQRLEIENISVSPKGIIQAKNIVLFDKQDENEFAKVDGIVIVPDYNSTFKSWSKDKNKFDVPLKVDIRKAQVKQSPVVINLDAGSDVLLTLDLKNQENFNYSGQLDLEYLEINQVPVLGDISKIKGKIDFYKNAVYGSDISGIVNDSVFKLDFLVEDYKDPAVELHCRLDPLALNVECALKDNTLQITDISASYNNINLNIAGKIDDIRTDPVAQVGVKADIDLEDLDELPLEIKETLKALKPQGVLKSQISLQGPLKDIPKLQANINLDSSKMLIADYPIEHLKLKADVKDGKLELSDLSGDILSTNIIVNGRLDLSAETLPYSLNLRSSNARIDRFKDILAEKAKLKNNLNGSIDIFADIQGQAKDLNDLKLELRTNLRDFAIDDISLGQLVELDADLSIKSLKQLIIRKLTVNDANSRISANGNIADFSAFDSDLSISLNTKLENLRSYSVLKLPANMVLNGSPRIDCKVKGPLTKPDKLAIDFELTGEQISYNQFQIDQINTKGSLNAMKLDLGLLFIKLYNGKIDAKAKADLSNMAAPGFNLLADISELDMQSFARSSGLIQQDFQGRLNGKISADGSGADLKTLYLKSNINLELTNAMVSNIPITRANAGFNLTYQDMNLLIKDATVVYKDIQAKAAGQIKDVTGAKQTRLDIATDLNLEDLDKLPVPQSLKAQLDSLGLKGALSAKLILDGPLSQPNLMNINADFASDQIEIKKVMIEAIKLKSNLKDKVLTAVLDLDAYQGTASVNAKAELADMENFTYNCLADISNIDIGMLIEQSQIIAGAHKGIVSLTADLSGQGRDLKTLNGKANLKLNDAVITSMGMLNLFAKIFKAEFLSNFQITQGNMDLIFAGQKAALENTSFDGPDALIKATGAVLLENLGFDNFLVTLMLTDSGADQIPGDLINGVFNYSEGYYRRTVEVEGTLTAPIVDQSKILVDIGKKQLFKQIFKQDSPSPGQTQEKPAEQLKKKLIGDVLEGLFK